MAAATGVGAIPYYNFGGDGPLIHFAHANAYPPACYRAMIVPLLADYRVIGMCLRPLLAGHPPEELDDWKLFAGDLIDFLDQQGHKGVIGMGHSLGAVATMFAAIERPDLFRALVLIEPVFLPPELLALAEAHPGPVMDLPLVQGALRRRAHWPSRQAAFDHFRGKSVFARWPDETLWDYVNNGVRQQDGEWVLAFPREWEGRIYALPPTTVWQEIGRITQPTLAIRGAESDTLSVESWQRWQTIQPEARFMEIEDAGHLVTMERPEVVAGVVLTYLAA